MRLLARVMADAGTDREAVRNALAQVGQGGGAHDGVVGRVAFDSLGDVPELKVQIGLVRGGVLLPAG